LKCIITLNIQNVHRWLTRTSMSASLAVVFHSVVNGFLQ